MLPAWLGLSKFLRAHTFSSPRSKMGDCCGKQAANKEFSTVIEDALQMGKKPVFWIIGGPGSGKGTQCFRLSMKYKLAHLSTGDLLRGEVGRGSELGKQIHSMVTSGQLVPREIVLDILKNAMIQAYPHVKGYLIDGYPREVVQGQEFLTKVGPCTKLIYFQCSDETMKTRLTKRAETSGRADDNNLQTVLNRIKLFHDISEEVVRSYDSILYTVDSDREPDQVFADCCILLDPIIAPIEEPEPLPPPTQLGPPPRGSRGSRGPPPGGPPPPPPQQQQY